MLASYKRSDYWCPPCLQGGALSIRQYAAPGRAVCTVAKQEAVCQHAPCAARALCVTAWRHYKVKPGREI